MANQKQFSSFIIFCFCWLLLIQNSGCKKDYSYEAQDSTVTQPDSTHVSGTEFPPCSGCRINDALQEGKWNFRIRNSFLCGIIDKGIITAEKTAFTFFGPSACSSDSGLVITAYMESEVLDRDKFNVTTNKVAFYYYDHNAPKHIFISQPTTAFSLTVQSFIYSTGIATGTFSGGVFRANGEVAFIKEGKFKVKLQ